MQTPDGWWPVEGSSQSSSLIYSTTDWAKFRKYPNIEFFIFQLWETWCYRAFRKFQLYYLGEYKVYEISVKYEEEIEIKDKTSKESVLKYLYFKLQFDILWNITNFIKIFYYVDIQRLQKKSRLDVRPCCTEWAMQCSIKI